MEPISPQQINRQVGLKTALGPDKLVLNRVSIRERISTPFEIEAQLSSRDGAIDYSKIVGHPATLRLDQGDKGKRYFNGIVSRFRQTSTQGGFARYHATIVPWLWFLTRTSDCRIFQRKSVLDIAQEVFEGNRFGTDSFEIRTQGSFPSRRFCVQYRETDFNFISRLLESEGIYYWFEHKDGQHKLILANSLSGSQPMPGYDTVEYKGVESGPAPGHEVITDWVVDQEVQPVQFELKDFDFKKPSDPLESKYEQSRPHGMARFSAFDYPGEYFEKAEGTRQAQLRLEELQSRYELVQGVSQSRGMAAGHTFKLKGHPRADQDRQYLILSSNLTLDAGEFASGGGGEQFIQCEFQAIPAKTPYRPPRHTPKPVVQGLQTALVVGPSGEEIHVDDRGRVKVHFHWDRKGKPDQDASCWVRVSQTWAGGKWGGIHIPRVGQEVLVEFLEGDPDRPIVTGRVYNEEQQPPYSLPANKTQSGIKSRSSKGGSDENYNEIRFEDKKGQEEILIHAEKNKSVVVENDRTEQVGHDEKISIGNNRTEDVGKDESISIGNNRTESVAKNENITIGENRSTDVGKNEDVTIGGSRTEEVAKDEKITIGANREESVGKDEKIEIAGGRIVEVGKDDKQNVGKKYALIAGDEIVLKAGDASITLKKDGTIQIKGKDITISGSGKVGVKASSDLTLKGSKIAGN